ncbi:hypothetical protein Pelo_18973 [Pelomyxa schiedti]|nr:hypothetical protein Pelo_18973 [Pelomyxa schiedti]
MGAIAEPRQEVGQRLGAQARQGRRVRGALVDRPNCGTLPPIEVYRFVCECVTNACTVCGCVGNDRVLCSSLCLDESWRGYCRVLNVSMEEDGGAGKERNPFDRSVWSAQLMMCGHSPSVVCNRKWIVVLVPGSTELHIWKVVGDGTPGDQQVSVYELGFEAEKLESGVSTPFGQDFVMVFPLAGGSITVVDLDSSFKAGSLVINSVLPQKARNALKEETNQVIPISENHVFSAPWFTGSTRLQFSVYHTGSPLPPVLSLPATWASPGCYPKSGLLFSTTQNLKCSKLPPCVVFSLHDGITGLHFGNFNVPNHFFF